VWRRLLSEGSRLPERRHRHVRLPGRHEPVWHRLLQRIMFGPSDQLLL
jgi:hypothetical protein